MDNQLPPKHSTVVLPIYIIGILTISALSLAEQPSFLASAEITESTPPEVSRTSSLVLSTRKGLETVPVSQDFARFLSQNETSFVKRWGNNQEVCRRECYASVEDLKYLQRRFEAITVTYLALNCLN
jgi:hypothetical protein